MKHARSNALRRNACGGLTLIEMVVALALVGMMATVLFESLKFGQRSYQKTVQRGDDQWQIFATQRLIRALIENAYPREPASTDMVREYGLHGNERSIAVTASAPLANGGGGLYRYEIALRGRAAGGNDVVVRWRPDFAATAEAGVIAEEILLERVASLEWSYQGGARDVAGTDDVTWRDAWDNQRALPKLVRLRVSFAPADARRWPDLIVAPRITDDANCLFDVVAQRCRDAS